MPNSNGPVFWKDLTPYSSPLHTPKEAAPRILIVGGGVTGLVTAWTLLDKGFHVTILAKEWASYGKSQRLTSQIAGALWEFPPAVCGQHTDAISLANSKRWCMVTYHILDAMAASSTLAEKSGVRMKPAGFFFPFPVEENPTQTSKMHEIIASGVRGFRHDPAIIKERRINTGYGAVDAYEHLAPIIDSDMSMIFLMDLVKSKGARMITRTITGDLLDQELALRHEFNADVIINATGLAGTEVASDASCYPIRGGLIRVINDGHDFPKVDSALTISADAVNANEIVFLVPRNDKILLIGGIAEPNIDKLDHTLDSPIIKRMRARCEAFLPGLEKARLDPDYPLAQGLRPFRQTNVRVERELRPMRGTTNPSRIIHNYGHGGAGWTLSFGCAGDVVALVEEALLDLPPRPMMIEGAAVACPAVKDLPAASLGNLKVTARL